MTRWVHWMQVLHGRIMGIHWTRNWCKCSMCHLVKHKTTSIPAPILQHGKFYGPLKLPMWTSPVAQTHPRAQWGWMALSNYPIECRILLCGHKIKWISTIYIWICCLFLSLILNSKCRTLVMGYGTAPPEHLSMLVIIVACVGMGIPFLLLIGGGAYVFVKRARNRWTMQWINGKWMGWMSYDVRYVSSEDRTMMSTNRLRMWTN